MTPKRILCVLGTRPEAIKMAPVIKAFASEQWAELSVVNTGQHRELAASVLGELGVRADAELAVMQHNQTLSGLSARLMEAIDQFYATNKPDLVLAQGDTTSVMIAALCAFYNRIPFAHVEAGLRTHDLQAPFPEELNRVVAGRMADLHFAPTARARDNLLREGAPEARIFVTGNTVIDALYEIVARPTACAYPRDPNRALVLVTAHRRENFGEPLTRICDAIRLLHDRYPELEFVYPVHPNPNVGAVVHQRLGDLARVSLIAPVAYSELATLINRSRFVMTDSGGIQEEAPALSKPVLVLREETERPEVIEAGVGRIVGTQIDRIVGEVERLLHDRAHFERMATGGSPFGDGRAAQRIVGHCADLLGVAGCAKSSACRIPDLA